MHRNDHILELAAFFNGRYILKWILYFYKNCNCSQHSSTGSIPFGNFTKKYCQSFYWSALTLVALGEQVRQLSSKVEKFWYLSALAKQSCRNGIWNPGHNYWYLLASTWFAALKSHEHFCCLLFLIDYDNY